MKFSSSVFKQDFKASIVVFLVALPLAMGIAIASGYPPIAGLISGVIGGVIVGALSGAPLQVSGAAAGLVVVVYDGIDRFGIEQMGLVLIAAGIFQVVAGALRLGRLFQAISPTVLYAMLAGIGALIVVGQFHVMFDKSPAGSGIDNLMSIPATFFQAFSDTTGVALFAFGLGLLTIFLLAVWPWFARHGLAFLPAPLAAISIAAAFAWITSGSVNYVLIPDDIFSAWKSPSLDFTRLFDNPAMLALAAQLALIASAESLLCANATDRLHDGERTRFDRELAAQGIGNTLCGLAGALPITGVIVRSSANVQAGAKTRLSTIMHGLWILLFVVLLPGVLSLVPTAALAGLLVYTGAKLISLQAIKRVIGYGRAECGIYAVTFTLIIAYDLLVGIVVGMLFSGAKVFYNLAKLKITRQEAEEEEGRLVVELEGAATFLQIPRIASTFDGLPRGATVQVRSRNLRIFDPACSEHLQVWRQRYESQGGKVESQLF